MGAGQAEEPVRRKRVPEENCGGKRAGYGQILTNTLEFSFSTSTNLYQRSQMPQWKAASDGYHCVICLSRFFTLILYT
jgi:hypothetical protein